jgi:HemK-related putative methylase
MNVYAPREDSFLLEEFVKELAFGSVLDMGTGSGIQAKAAAKKENVKSVLAVDINPQAVKELEKKAIKKIKVIQSNLFQNITKKFDTIIFNPPYLPNEEKDPDLALDGGEEGWELIEVFLKQARNHLKEKGIILLLFSNLTNKEKIDKIIKEQTFEKKLLGKKSLAFFEELYVYKLTLKDIYGKGKRGIITVENDVCIKEKNPDAKADTIEKEAFFLKKLNEIGVGPKFISYKDGKLKREFVEGKQLKEFLEEEKDKKRILEVFEKVLLQCFEMDKLNINKQELENPYKDIIITKDYKVFLIDFERCRFTTKPKNLTQFLQYIAKVSYILKERNVNINKEELITLGKEYKKEINKEKLNKIIKELKTNFNL